MTVDPDPITAIHRLAARQGFVLSRQQARQHGIADSSFTDHVRRLGWVPRTRGVWGPPGWDKDHLGHMTAISAAIGPPLLVTGASALWLDGVVRQPPAQAEVLVPASRRPMPRAGLCVHLTSSFDKVRARSSRGLLLVSTARALIDYSAHASFEAVVRAIADACRLRLCTLRQVEREIARRQRFPGRRVVRAAHAELSGALTHSRYERLGRGLLLNVGLDIHPRPYPVTRRNRVIAEIDIAMPAIYYGVEIDGPPHLLPEVAARDRQRDRELARERWIIDRFMWFELEKHPDRFVREVLAQIHRLKDEHTA